MELSFELTFGLDWFGMIPLNYKLYVDLWGKNFLPFFARGLAKFKLGEFDKCIFYLIFIILLFIKIFIFPLFLLIGFNFYLYLSIHLCFEGMRRFQINLRGLYMQSGARPIESSQLTSSQAWIQEKTNPIKFMFNWSKESKEICTKSKSNSD